MLLVGFWFDGGLFKLATAAVFWTLMELGRLGTPDASERRSPDRLDAADTVQPAGSEPGARCVKQARGSLILRWLAGILAAAALALTLVHVITPRMSVSDLALAIARNRLVQPTQRDDFDFLAKKPIWNGKPMKWLLDHVALADYNRTLVCWTIDEDLYRNFVLSPQISPAYDADMNWRRPLWEHFYPRIRRETDPRSAAEMVIKELSYSMTPIFDRLNSTDIRAMWKRGTADATGLEAIYVAALRSVGIPARRAASGQTELWWEAGWQPAPRPATNR